MLEFLRGKASTRKLQLYVVACCRANWKFLSAEASRAAVEAAEREAEGLLSRDDLNNIYVAADEAYEWTCKKHEYAPDAYGKKAPPEVRWAGIAAMSVIGEEENAAKAAVDVAIERELIALAELFRDIFAPFHSTSTTSSVFPDIVRNLAKTIYESGAFDRLPQLADALEDDGCTDATILEHCRGPGPHVRGCWVVDLLLGKS
jgi:hypothetical protein